MPPSFCWYPGIWPMLCTMCLIRCDGKGKRKFPSLKSQAWSLGEEEEEGLKWLLYMCVIISAHWLLLLETSLPYLAMRNYIIYIWWCWPADNMWNIISMKSFQFIFYAVLWYSWFLSYLAVFMLNSNMGFRCFTVHLIIYIYIFFQLNPNSLLSVLSKVWVL